MKPKKKEAILKYRICQHSIELEIFVQPEDFSKIYS